MMTLVLAALTLIPLLVDQEAVESETVVVGRLIVRDGKSLLGRDDAELRLTSRRTPIEATLADDRVAGREFRLVGRFLGDGRFEVKDFFVLRDGKALRLVYYCERCNITTFSPGLCDCCREPTLPIEIPLNDPRVYHPGDPARPGPQPDELQDSECRPR